MLIALLPMFALPLALVALSLTVHASPAPTNIVRRQASCANDTEIQDFTLAAADASTGVSQPLAVDFTAVLAVCSLLFSLDTYALTMNTPLNFSQPAL